MNDKSFEVNKNGEEIMDIPKDNDNKKITITKNTKVILKKMGKQPKILKTDNTNTKENKKIVKKKEIKNIKTGKNMIFLDDSKDNESNISTKNLNTENLSNQKYVIIKNDIDNKNNKEKSGEKIHFRLNRSPIANNETKQIKQPISLPNNNITVKYTSDQRNKTNNSDDETIRQNNLLLKGMIKLHTITCLKEDCPLTKYVRNKGNYNIQKQCLLNYMAIFFKNSIFFII